MTARLLIGAAALEADDDDDDLTCGHPDDDPHAWHWGEFGEEPVCSRCCVTCNKDQT